MFLDADIPLFFTDFSEPAVFEGVQVSAVFEPLTAAEKANDALADVDLIVFVPAASLATKTDRIQTGQTIILNGRRFTIIQRAENYGVFQFFLARKDGF